MYDKVHHETEPFSFWNRRLAGLAIAVTIGILVVWGLSIALIKVAHAIVSPVVLQILG
jgi:hypothetical protein